MATGNVAPDYSTIEGMDPAADWLLGPALNDYLPDPDAVLIPFLLELPDEEAVAAFRALPQGPDSPDGCIVLGFADGKDLVKAGALLPILAPLEWFENLRDGKGPFEQFRPMNKRIVLSTPIEAEKGGEAEPILKFLTSQRSAPASRESATTTVFTAVIDDGIAFAQERLRLGKTETRVEAYWNMNALFDRLRPEVSSPLRGELLKHQIDALLAGGTVDEDAIYAAKGVADFRDPRHKTAAWRRSHGAHVLDLAAGHDAEACVLDRPVVAVQLPSWVVAQTSGMRLDFYLWFALLYVLYTVDWLTGWTGSPKLVINTSFGYIAAPHDGKEPLDRFMDKTIRDRRPNTQIVLSAGNAHLSRCHAEISFAKSATVAFDLIVQPGDRTQSEVEVWLPEKGPVGDRMILTVTLPDGKSYPIVEQDGQKVELRTAAGNLVGRVLLATLGDQRMFHLVIAPTERPQPHPGLLAPAGRWILTFAEGETKMTESAHAWVQRDDSLYGYPQRGRQSYFEHEDYVRFDECGFPVTDDPSPAVSPVMRKSLFSAIATGAEVITAGGYQERDGVVAPYSAGGPNCPPENGSAEPPRKPDVLLPSDGSKAHPGVLAAGSRSGGRVLMNGTSVAAPQLARYVVELLAAGEPADRQAIADAAEPHPPSPPAPPDPAADRSGWGRLPRFDRLDVDRFDRD